MPICRWREVPKKRLLFGVDDADEDGVGDAAVDVAVLFVDAFFVGRESGNACGGSGFDDGIEEEGWRSVGIGVA